MEKEANLVQVKFISKKIKTNQIFLDPNNFRLFGVTRREETPENRITNENIQRNILEEMKRVADLLPLRNSILEVGFQPVDRIVVRKFDKNKYIVMEGNRRVAAIKWILQDYERGELNIPPEKLATYKKLDVLIVEGPREDVLKYQKLIQGIRHVQGIKNWGPYQRALMMVELYEKMKMKPRDIAYALGGGISVKSVMNSIRAFKALKQMEEDEEFGESVTPELYSFFEEVMKKPYLRDQWLRWSDEENKFTYEENLRLFYSWIVPSEEMEGNKKIPMAIKVRNLPTILQDPELYRFFLQPNIDIDRAMVEAQIRRRQTSIPWREKLQEILTILKGGIPLCAEINEEDIKLLQSIKELTEKLLEKIHKLKT
jgi:hypothetical protein